MTRFDIVLEVQKITKDVLDRDIVEALVDFIEDNFYQDED